MSNRILPQRKRPLRMYSEAFATTKPLPKNTYEYGLLLEEFGENLVSDYQKLLDHAEKTMVEMSNISTMPPFIVPRITEVPRGD